jgi:hypothetical protein
MQVRPLLLLFLALACLFPDRLAAQQPGTATLTGLVVDDETGDPLQGAHVFIAVSMMGTVTGPDGRFQLSGVPLGAHRVYVSMIGFVPEARDVMLRADTKIVNPEVLDFEEKAGYFRASASEPLIIENRALGYRIQYFLKEFVAEPNRTKYDGEPLYEILPPADAAQAQSWAEKRREAFMGSFRHFMLAALAGRVEEQGFKVYSRPAPGPDVRAASLPNASFHANQRFPIEASELLKPGETPTERILDFDGMVEIIYMGEVEDEAYLAWQNERRKPRYRTSWIQLEKGPTVIDYKGDVLDPYGVTFYGYLAFERVADEVPKEYRPN